MALDLRQNLKLSQQLMMTPQLQQAIKLLQLSRVELEQFVSQQLAENPILEESATDFTDDRGVDERNREVEKTSDDFMRSDMTTASAIVDKVGDGEARDVDWEALSRLKEATQQPVAAKVRDEESPNYENMVSSRVSLSQYLMEQVGELDFTPQEKAVAALLIGNLSDKGYLELDLTQFCRDEELDLEFVEGILDTLQRLNPPGIAARNLAECLQIQLREYHLRNGIVEKIVESHMHELETRNFAAIAKSMKISLDDVIKNVAFIAELDPIPAREFGGDPAQQVIPDVYVFQMAGKWLVSLNEDGLPRLRVSDYYRDIAEDKAKGQDKDYIHEKIKSANWLIKSIQQRQRTIFKVTQCIVDRQQEFFEKGVQYLKPMILKDIAEDIGMHESTISRVTSQKYMHTPRGIFELKYFFNSSVARAGGGDMASESVKVLIKEIVDKEDVKRPFSDQKIVSLLEDKGVKLARRTVAKYREQLNILPSSKRKKYF